MEWEDLITPMAGPCEQARSATSSTHFVAIVPARFTSDSSSPTPNASLVLPELNSTSIPALAIPVGQQNETSK